MRVIRFFHAKLKNRSYVTRFSSTNSPSFGYCHKIGREPLSYTTIGKLVEASVNKWPGRVAIVSKQEDVTITYGKLLQKADALAASLKEVGLEKGDKLGIWMPNSWLWLVVNLAASRAGFVLVTLNPAYERIEFEKCCNKVGIKAVVILESFRNQNYYGMLREMVPELEKGKPDDLVSGRLPSLKTVIVLTDKDLPGIFRYESFTKIANPQAVQRIASEQNLIGSDKGSLIQFTSGTTSDPKAVLQSHFSVSNASLLAGVETQLVAEHHKICVQLPFFHCFANTFIAGGGLINGATVVIPSMAYNPRKFYDAFRSENCTRIHGAPTMFVDMLSVASEVGGYSPASSCLATIGGALVTPQLFKLMKSQLNLQQILVGYALTETSGVSFISKPDEESPLLKLVDHCEAKVISVDGETLLFGQEGELCFRGFSVMNEYLHDEKKTKESLGPDRWFRTGDQAQLFEDGSLEIVGRIKEMIIRGGENIYPKEIEDVINTHDDILESHVFGISDDRLGEDLCVGIRLKEGANNLTAQQMKSFCAGKISKFKIPKNIRIVSSFPKTTTGKVQKFKLKEMVENGQL